MTWKIKSQKSTTDRSQEQEEYGYHQIFGTSDLNGPDDFLRIFFFQGAFFKVENFFSFFLLFALFWPQYWRLFKFWHYMMIFQKLMIFQIFNVENFFFYFLHFFDHNIDDFSNFGIIWWFFKNWWFFKFEPKLMISQFLAKRDFSNFSQNWWFFKILAKFWKIIDFGKVLKTHISKDNICKLDFKDSSPNLS